MLTGDMSTRKRCLVLLVSGLSLAGCRPPAAVGPEAAPGEPCWLTPAPKHERGGTVVSVALLDTLDPAHAPLAANPSERLVFAQIYEGLVAVDCRGRVQPGLARSWSVDSDAARWVFVLRDGARLSDGTEVEGETVVRAWDAARKRAAGRPASVGESDPWGILREGSAWGRGDTLWVSITTPIDRDGRFFADPALAVTVLKGGSRPLGSGPFRWGDTGALRLVPNPHHPRPAACEIALEIQKGSDPRDVLGAGADVVQVRDREVIAYAEGTSSHLAVPLPWDLRYAAWFGGGAPVPESERTTLAQELASAVAVADARPAPRWPYPECRDKVPAPGSGSPRPGQAIEYPAGDPDAEALAARLAALANTEPCPAWLVPYRGARVREVPAADLARRMAAGMTDGITVSPHALLPDPCPAAGSVDLRALIPVPLMDTRAHLVARRGLDGFLIDGYGTVLLSRVVRDPAP